MLSARLPDGQEVEASFNIEKTIKRFLSSQE